MDNEADLVIRNGLVIGGDGTYRGGLAARDGVIVAMGPDDTLPAGETEIDAGGKVVLPGAIDPHTHFGVGGAADEAKFTSDWVTETRAAATGGITTMVTNHENATGPSFITTTITEVYDGREMTLLDKAKTIAGKGAVIDHRFTALPQSEAHLDEIPTLIEQGVTSFKFYPSYSAEEAADFGIEKLDWDFIYNGFRRLAACRNDELIPIGMIHCEEPTICLLLKNERIAAGHPGDPVAWEETRPAICEAMQIYDVGMVSKETGARAYVVHTSSKEGTDAIQYLRSQGVDIIGETCTHYLILTKQELEGPWAKVNPPIRDNADRERMWQALAEGTHEVVGSDDCGKYTREEKLSKGFWDAIPGFSDMSASLTLLISEGVLKGRLTWEQLSHVISRGAARNYNMFPRKGILRIDSDADIVIVDPEERWTLSPQALNYSADFSIYDGREVTGRPVQTFVRGTLVVDHGEVVVDSGHGRYVPSGLTDAELEARGSAVGGRA